MSLTISEKLNNYTKRAKVRLLLQLYPAKKILKKLYHGLYNIVSNIDNTLKTLEPLTIEKDEKGNLLPTSDWNHGIVMCMHEGEMIIRSVILDQKGDIKRDVKGTDMFNLRTFLSSIPPEYIQEQLINMIGDDEDEDEEDDDDETINNPKQLLLTDGK